MDIMYNQIVLGKIELQTTTVIFSRGNIGEMWVMKL